MQEIKRKRLSSYSLGFAVPALIVYGIFFILPSVIGLVFSFTDMFIDRINEIQFNGFDNFKQILDATDVGISFKNTLLFTFISTFFKCTFGLLLALLLNRSISIAKFTRTVYFAPCVLSPLVIGLVFSALYNPDNGFINNFLRMIGLTGLTREWLGHGSTAMGAICFMDVWQWSGFCMVIFIAALQTIPKEINETSYIDGAGPLQKFFKITIPLIMPSFTVNILLSLIGGLKVFMQVMVLTNGGPGKSTYVVNLLIFKEFSQGMLGYASALNLIFTIFITAVSLLALYIIRKAEVEYN